MNEDQFAMNEIRDAIASFRSSMRHEGDQTESPGLEAILQRDAASRGPRTLRWVAVAAVVVILGAIPFSYQRTREQQQRAAAQAREDALLLEKVNAGLSRTVPRSLEPLLKWEETR
jgi:hypothetical protein